MIRRVVDNLSDYPDRDEVEKQLAAMGLNCESPTLREFQAYYNSKADIADGIPSRSDISPSDFPHILENIFLVELRGHPDDGATSYFYRVLGSALSRLIGQDLSQKSLADYKKPARRERSVLIYNYVVREKVPARVMGYVTDEYDKLRRIESISFPLSHDGVNVNMIIGIADFIDA